MGISSKYSVHLGISPYQGLVLHRSSSWVSLKLVKKCKFILELFLSRSLTHISENPFNYDLNDLDLDYFCLSLQRELHQITAVSALSRH
jgi:hypothetical protein